MLLYFHEKLRELHLTYIEFFDVAYYWKFQKSPSLNADLAQYILHGVLPSYVVSYLKHLQEVPCANVIAPSVPVTSSLAAALSGSGESSLTSE